MKEIIILIDYKNAFGSKHFAVPYRSGYSHKKLSRYFQTFEYNVRFININKFTLEPNYIGNKIVLYTISTLEAFYLDDVLVYFLLTDDVSWFLLYVESHRLNF